MKLRTRLATREPARQPGPQAPAEEPVSPAARNLALAYKIEQWIEQGLVDDYGHAARMLGVSQVRISHIASMRLLAPTVQSGILTDDHAQPQRELRTVARLPSWIDQLAHIRQSGKHPPTP